LAQGQHGPEAQPTAGRRPAAGRHRLRRRQTRRLPRRDRAERHRERERRGRAEREDAHVEREPHVDWKHAGRHQRRRGIENRPAERDPEHGRQWRKHEALGEEQPRDAPSASAKRRTHGELAGARRRPRKHEVRDIGANQQEDQAKRPHQQLQYGSDVSHNVLLERVQARCNVKRFEHLCRTRRLAPSTPDATHVLIRQRNRHARLEPSDACVVERFRSGRRFGKALRKKNVRRNVDESKALRHNADHFTRNEIDRYGAANKAAIASKLALPIPVTQDHSSW